MIDCDGSATRSVDDADWPCWRPAMENVNYDCCLCNRILCSFFHFNNTTVQCIRVCVRVRFLCWGHWCYAYMYIYYEYALAIGDCTVGKRDRRFHELCHVLWSMARPINATHWYKNIHARRWRLLENHPKKRRSWKIKMRWTTNKRGEWEAQPTRND